MATNTRGRKEGQEVEEGEGDDGAGTEEEVGRRGVGALAGEASGLTLFMLGGAGAGEAAGEERPCCGDRSGRVRGGRIKGGGVGGG
jgi:hypothetical protein